MAVLDYEEWQILQLLLLVVKLFVFHSDESTGGSVRRSGGARFGENLAVFFQFLINIIFVTEGGCP
jgi:hypothetical protein